VRLEASMDKGMKGMVDVESRGRRHLTGFGPVPGPRRI